MFNFQALSGFELEGTRVLARIIKNDCASWKRKLGEGQDKGG